MPCTVAHDSGDWDLGASVVDIYQLPARVYARIHPDRDGAITWLEQG